MTDKNEQIDFDYISDTKPFFKELNLQACKLFIGLGPVHLCDGTELRSFKSHFVSLSLRLILLLVERADTKQI